MERKFNKKRHEKHLEERTKNWGKGNNKFKPKPYVPQVATEAKPWHHVKNNIIDDADEANQQKQLNMESTKAKKFLKIREQNHRRNIIEAKRNEPTSWESFSESKTKKKEYLPKAIFNAQKKEVKDLTFEDRNYFRRKLTKANLSKDLSLKSVTTDLARNGVLRGKAAKKKKKNQKKNER